MKFAIFCLLAMSAVVLARPEKYTNRYDNINIDEILENKKLLEGYFKCILDKVRCTSEGKELKSHIQEALETNCEKCTDVQRSQSDRILKHLIHEEPNWWAQLTAKYDPQNKYAVRYEKRLGALKA